MSGIAGIFYRHRRPVQPTQLAEMAKALVHRGKDGISYFCHKSVGMVHCQWHDTPESLLETLPHAVDGGRLVITFHGRIDNREELRDQLAWQKPLSATTDSDLVVAAYDKWGKGCTEYLLGDFAFAIWNDREQKLYCARDHMGIKPFYYYLDDSRFVFASEIKGLLALPEIPRIMNEVRVADYLTSVVLDKELTFYQQILRLPPGHILEVQPEGAQLERYHQFAPVELRWTKDSEYEEQFRAIFAEAVRCRLRSAFPVGSYLSGGLDSASIVCTAAGLFETEMPGRLQTFSGVFNDLASCDEREYFSSVVERYSLISHAIPVDTINPALAYERLIQDEDEPFLSPHIFMSLNLLPLVRESGVRILLDGHDGDAAVSYGTNITVDLALSGKLRQLVDCYREAGVKSGKSIARRILSVYWNVLCVNIHRSLPYVFPGKELAQSLKMLNPDLVERTGIRERRAARSADVPRYGQKEAVFHLKNITQSIQVFVLEFFERLTTREGIVARYPFFDKRVIEFCLALPTGQKYQQGLNRSIVRRSLADLLPEGIRNRKDKTDFTPSLLHAFRNNDLGWLLHNIDNIDKFHYDFIDKAFCLDARARYNDSGNPLGQMALGELLLMILFSRWKRKFFG